ncbi:MAG TPA: hypothetical protein VE913_02740 [Longimicrobium sp.]|nr:hypothetical protein [Longimicrobium sp.]
MKMLRVIPLALLAALAACGGSVTGSEPAVPDASPARVMEREPEPAPPLEGNGTLGSGNLAVS